MIDISVKMGAKKRLEVRTSVDGEEILAAIYLRVSTDKQEIENQKRQLVPFCKKSNWEIYKIYEDVMTGRDKRRPGFNTMFKDARKKLFDVVLFWDISRFSRSGALYTLQKFNELEGLGIGWHSYNEQYLTTVGDYRDGIISFLACMASAEAERISDRTKAGLERAKAEGKVLGRGISIKPRDIKRIWEEYKIQGSINRTAKVVKRSYGTVHRIIKNEIRTMAEYIEFVKTTREKRRLSTKGGACCA